jgi:hypothetical protein
MIRLNVQALILLLCLLASIHADEKSKEQQDIKGEGQHSPKKEEKTEDILIEIQKSENDMKALIEDLKQVKSEIASHKAKRLNIPLKFYQLLIEEVKKRNKNISGKAFMAIQRMKNESTDEPMVSLSKYDERKKIADVIVKNPKNKMSILQKWYFSGNSWTPHYPKEKIVRNN